MASAETQCQALQLSDEQRCQNEATHADGLFCKFHAKQVYGLYKGYKRRNALLDSLELNAPSFLRNSGEPLANQTFKGVEDESTLQELHSHLSDKYVLIGKVIDARKLHHKHFYSLHVDYGHQAYLDKLSNERHITLRALERLEKRTAEVLYHKERWYAWVRQAQEDEEAAREKEQKLVKQEAALFKRQMKKLEARLALMREKEEKDRQDAYLEDAYQERMSLSADEGDLDETWDPIEDVKDHKRHRYIDLIKHFLWMEGLQTDVDNDHPMPDAENPTDQPSSASEGQMSSKKGKKTKGTAPRKPPSTTQRGQAKLLAMQNSKRTSDEDEGLQEPDSSNIETEEEMKKRLSQGVEKNLENISGFQVIGTMDNPYETYNKTAPVTDSEIQSLLSDIREVKLLLFCRLLLAHASMLPAALKANSVQEFLSDVNVSESDLRDLCLKVAEPSLQDIRDACADFARGNNADDEGPEEAEEEDDDKESYEDLLNDDRRFGHLQPNDWLYQEFLEREEKRRANKKKKRKGQGRSARAKGAKQSTMAKVTICGKSIWPHSSKRAMSRDGWLQFSVLAKDCDLKHAIQLCRNWAEFSELNFLTLWDYFPASNWASWGGERTMQQLYQLEFFPYFVDFEAQQRSRHNSTGSRGQGRRAHDIIETRNIIVGHMKRNDAVTRRFIQYLLMRTGEVLVLVRDGKTGRVITAPPEEQLWTYRKKQGLGRASKNEWHNVLEVGPDYFDLIELLREWRFGFDDYYDIFIWDFVPSRSSMEIYNIIIMELRNARRVRHPRDVFAHNEPLLRTLTREKDTMRTRQIKPGERVESLWDTIMHESMEFRLYELKDKAVTERGLEDLKDSPNLFYNDSNVAEDKVLFPDELTSGNKNTRFREIENSISRIENAILPTTMRTLMKGMEAMDKGQDPLEALKRAKDNDGDSIWALPKVWETGLKQLRQEALVAETRELLKRTGLFKPRRILSVNDRMNTSDPMETMERDRSFGFKEAFHAADFEPGSTEKYGQVQDKIEAMLSTPHSGPTDWIIFLAEILDWLQLRADYDDYTRDPSHPWPHGFIGPDLVRAFAAMAMFFPECNATTLVTKFLNSKQCEDFKNSRLFDADKRRKSRPDRRTRTSYKYRSKGFWTEWNAFMKTDRYFVDKYPVEWSVAIRPIIAHLYRIGIIKPAFLENTLQIVLGVATAHTEPHRPNKLDLFINYDDRNDLTSLEYPSFFVSPNQWPELLPVARSFNKAHPGARFALLRLWSASHFYPLMVGPGSRRSTSFLDSVGRSWEWKFVPKDLPGSEMSLHYTVGRRLELLKKQFAGNVTYRGDLILVRGKDANELLKYCTAVTFAMQTKPWVREVDLHKSFINVDLGFLEGLEFFWID